MTWLDTLRLRWAVRIFPKGSMQTVGNRWSTWSHRDHFEVTLTIRDTSEPDTYSREEVFVMLRTVREQEKRMGWTCPERPVIQ